jgi:hypothetical protein
MGKFLVRIGQQISSAWTKFVCWYNSLIIKLIVNIEDCPHKVCACKNK